MTLVEQLINDICMDEKATRLDLINLARRYAGWSTGAGTQNTFDFRDKNQADLFINDITQMGSYAQVIASAPSSVSVQVQ